MKWHRPIELRSRRWLKTVIPLALAALLGTAIAVVLSG